MSQELKGTRVCPRIPSLCGYDDACALSAAYPDQLETGWQHFESYMKFADAVGKTQGIAFPAAA